MRGIGNKEPTLSELLDDPLVRLLMRRDGVTRDDVEMLMADARRRAVHEAGRKGDAACFPSVR